MQEFTRIPHKMEMILQHDESGSTKSWRANFSATPISSISAAASTIPIALEGALKLKEISYIHAEGYPAGEMKHGPNALIDENLPVVVLATRDESDPDSVTRYEKSVSNIQEVKARDGIVISVVTEGDQLRRQGFRPRDRSPAGAGTARAAAGNRAAAIARLSHRRAPRLRRRPAAQPGQIRHCRVARAAASHDVPFYRSVCCLTWHKIAAVPGRFACLRRILPPILLFALAPLSAFSQADPSYRPRLSPA